MTAPTSHGSDAGRATAARENGKAEPERAGDPKRVTRPEDSGKEGNKPNSGGKKKKRKVRMSRWRRVAENKIRL